MSRINPTPQKFDEGRLSQVLVAPIISEKATMLGEKRNQVMFKVLRDATKPEIKAAVELMFKVEVAAVTTSVQKGKVKRFGRAIGRRDARARAPRATAGANSWCPLGAARRPPEGEFALGAARRAHDPFPSRLRRT